MAYYNAPPYRAVAFSFEYGLTSVTDTTIFKVAPTIAAGDVTVSQDGGAFTNITSLPAEIGATGVLTVALTATEMTADRVTVLFHDVAGTQWLDALVVLFTQTPDAGPGIGAVTWTYTLTSSVGGTPIAGAAVWATTDLTGTNVVASGVTATDGTVTMYLDAGTYYIWRQLAGWTFTNPDTEVVV